MINLPIKGIHAEGVAGRVSEPAFDFEDCESVPPPLTTEAE